MIDLIKSVLGAVIGLVLDPCKYKLHRWSKWLEFDETQTNEDTMRVSTAIKLLQSRGYPVGYGIKGATRWCRRNDCSKLGVRVYGDS